VKKKTTNKRKGEDSGEAGKENFGGKGGEDAQFGERERICGRYSVS
jgi:hypothetical protein